LKEGRKHGEVTWDGRDGAWRVQNEERVLKQLSLAGVSVPEVCSSFEIKGNYYLVMKFIEGETLHNRLRRRQRRLPVRQALKYAVGLAEFLSQMHQSGWTWRDCKPKNIIITRHGRLIPIDFEGASQIEKPDPTRWGTPGFVPAESSGLAAHSGIDDDLYGLGSILYLLITGRIYDAGNPTRAEKLRRDLPAGIAALIASLLTPDAAGCPSARVAGARINASLLRYSPQGRTTSRRKSARINQAGAKAA
jgi:serine/threonine protein kinase